MLNLDLVICNLDIVKVLDVRGVNGKLVDLGRLESPSRNLVLEQKIELSVRAVPVWVNTILRVWQRLHSLALGESEPDVDGAEGS
jgi:hypothetical protein